MTSASKRLINFRNLEKARGAIRRVILHVHRNPSTGVWSMMKNLARIQNMEHDTFSVIGVPADYSWIEQDYMMELTALDTPYLFARVPKLFGTGAFLLFILRNPIRIWVRKLALALPETEIVVHSHSAWLTGGYLPILESSKVAVVATFHGIADDHRLRSIWWLRVAHRFLAQRLYKSGSILTSVSREGAHRAQEIFGIPQEVFRIVPNGLSQSEFAPLGTFERPDELLVGHVGQMHEGKGWRLLLESVDRLRSRGLPIQLVMAGEGEDSPLAAQAARERPSYVRFLGYVPDAGTTLIPKLNALVLATWSEGMPMSVIEAFAAGVPVVATRVGGLPEMIEDGVNGLFIDRNAQSIESALYRLFVDTDLRDHIKKGARNTFEAKFSLSPVAKAYDELYEEALKRQRGLPKFVPNPWFC